MDNKAWDILTEDEQLSLTLSIQHNKSTWQAGEIMGKAHYKYLEINSRAKAFFKIFTEYFEKTNDLIIPEGVALHPDIAEFIRLTITNRMGYREAVKEIAVNSNTPLAINAARERLLKEYLSQLANDDNPLARDLYDLILDFDRWNNFRILPISLQEPSAFKRRNKTRLLKHLKNMKDLNEFHIDRFITKFKAKGTHRKKLFLPLISDTFIQGYDVVKIQNNKNIIEYLSNEFRLYAFEDKDDADDYGYLVESYLNNNKKDCKHGQIFWPKFRILITKAFNYGMVNNIIPRRKNLEKAFKDLDGKDIMKIREPLKSDAQKRSSKSDLWSI
jgi:uncharacterized FlgJ-related protein